MDLTIILILLSSQHFLRPTDAIVNSTSDRASTKNALTDYNTIKQVLAQINGTAVLPCRITDLGTGTVTWTRKRDRQLLTVGSGTHTMDTRFMVRGSPTDWTLNIKNVKPDDAGLYECQIPTEPILHRYVNLNITEAFTIIPGGPELHVKQGSSLRLECLLIAATELPTFVFWYRKGRMINYDAEPGLNVEATKNGSILVVEKTQMSHAGNYTCQPSNAKSTYVMIHVLEEEEKPAAMHGGDRPSSSPSLTTNFLLLLIVLFGITSSMRRSSPMSSIMGEERKGGIVVSS
ncbi:zwei Ig domain protein zig-8-like [Venturia canescens]|uniref:zwei Ig domain protein zig-8-like n=1 Tax=Venturia canescens TaxID=32260 RepID=UPI001C9C1C8F|nr:zwei Ig domain protein zig-8-like [Venturia canescens]XP_043287390.1 zwei Ig domain protein zig-8-like [Venturia canescens]